MNFKNCNPKLLKFCVTIFWITIDNMYDYMFNIQTSKQTNK